MKRKSTLWLSMMSAVMLMSACSGEKAAQPSGGKDPGTETPPAAASKVSTDPVTLKFAINFSWLGEDERKMYIVDPVKKKYPHITIEFINLTEMALDKVIASGTVPDIVQSANPIMYTFSDLGLEDNIEPLIKTHRFDTSKISKVGLDAVKISSGKDYLTGLPWTIAFNATYYNKDIFDKFGVAYPKDGMTWEEMRELARKVTRKEGEIQFRGLEPDVPSRMASVLSAGFVDPKTRKATLDTEGWKRTFEYMKSVYEIPGNEKYAWVPSAFDQFIKSRTLAMYPGLNHFPNFKGVENMNWDIVQYPQFKDKPNTGMQVDEWILHITKQSKYKDQAFQVLASILSEDVQMDMSRNGRFPILQNKAIQDEFGKNIPYLQGKNLKAIFLTQPAAPVPPSKDGAAGQAISQEAFKKVMNGTDINSALREADEALNKKIAESN
ncbi:extracellular solute-binding protein [Paenibacillus sp. GYB004]|uniref:ABC transporter substrate-binding protein n=1 Tax=Paenibacillus sp. GYB004 TaxID=2994393 RepID=UPI002F9686B3